VLNINSSNVDINIPLFMSNNSSFRNSLIINGFYLEWLAAEELGFNSLQGPPSQLLNGSFTRSKEIGA
jgi:hypothetical protein